MLNINFSRFELPKSITDNSSILVPAAVASVSLLVLKIISDRRNIQKTKDSYQTIKDNALAGIALTAALGAADLASSGGISRFIGFSPSRVSYLGFSSLTTFASIHTILVPDE